MARELLTRKETADLLRVTTYTIDKWAKEGILPARKIKRRVVFFRDEVLDVIRAMSCKNCA